MKRTLFSIAILSMYLTTNAQNPDKALARVRYSFSHIQDTTQRDKPYTENMLLVIGKNASVYTSYDKIKQSIDRENQLREQMKNQAGSGTFNVKISSQGNQPVSPLDYFFFAKENKFFTKERLFNNYLIEEEAPKISWKISKDSASFSGVKAQKATAYFKGRNWIAWFAPDMPFQSGPWKLNGLPGLIIEAYDEKKDVQFTFAGIDEVTETNSTAPAGETAGPKITGPNGTVVNIMGIDGNVYMGNEIKLPADAIKATKKELDKLKEARDKDPQGFMNAQLAGQGMGNVKVATGTRMVSSGPVNKITLNNPIELPEKK